jgi:hypothetical protein
MLENQYNEPHISFMNLATKITNLSLEHLETVYRTRGTWGVLAEVCENVKDLVTVDEMNAAISNALDAHMATVDTAITAAIDAHMAAEHNTEG